MTDISVDFCGKKLAVPLILVSGVLGTKAELLARVVKAGAGAVTTKSCCLLPRKGHENPTVIAWNHGIQNAVGLTNPGVNQEIEEIRKLKQLIKGTQALIIASFFGGTLEEFVLVAKKLDAVQPDFLELNISCPNIESDLGTVFASCPKATFKVVKAVKKMTKVPVIVKLSPNVTDIKIIAKAAESAGADALSAINTVSGMIIDVDAGQPVLTNVVGGISGPAIKPIAVRCIYEIFKTVKIPVIGIGGIANGREAVEMIMAGAAAVGIGSAVYFRGLNVFSKITGEIEEFLENSKYQSLKECRGIAHEKN